MENIKNEQIPEATLGGIMKNYRRYIRLKVLYGRQDVELEEAKAYMVRNPKEQNPKKQGFDDTAIKTVYKAHLDPKVPKEEQEKLADSLLTSFKKEREISDLCGAYMEVEYEKLEQLEKEQGKLAQKQNEVPAKKKTVVEKVKGTLGISKEK